MDGRAAEVGTDITPWRLVSRVREPGWWARMASLTGPPLVSPDSRLTSQKQQRPAQWVLRNAMEEGNRQG